MNEVYYKSILFFGVAFLFALALFAPMLIERLYDYFMCCCNPCDISGNVWCNYETNLSKI